MYRYVIRRGLLLIPTLLGVSIVVFSLVRLIPGDIANIMLEGAQATPEDYANLRHNLGLDRPFLEQYAVWIGNVLRGDLGVSFYTGQPALTEIMARLPVTVELASLAVLFSVIIALPISILATIRQDSLADYLARLVAILGLAVPGFWLGTLVVMLGALWFRWSAPLAYQGFFENPGVNLQQFLLPALVMAAREGAVVMRMARSTLLEVLRQDYIRTAWSKGLRERTIIFRHALKNAMIPVVTVIGLHAGSLLGRTVIIELIFALPGIGTLTLYSIYQRDYPQLQANVLFIAFLFVMVNLVVDLTYAWLDPRIRY